MIWNKAGISTSTMRFGRAVIVEWAAVVKPSLNTNDPYGWRVNEIRGWRVQVQHKRFRHAWNEVKYWRQCGYLARVVPLYDVTPVFPFPLSPRFVSSWSYHATHVR